MHLRHRVIPVRATRLRHMSRTRNIRDSMLLRWRRNILKSVLALHARGVSFPNGPGARSKGERVGGNKLLALRRLPFGALPWLDVQDVHGVDFLEGAALVLAQEEVNDEGAGEVAGGEDVAVAVVDVVCDKGSEEGDEEVPWKRCVS